MIWFQANRSQTVAVATSTLAVVFGGALSGCGVVDSAGVDAPSADSPTALATSPLPIAYQWPVAELTITTVPQGAPSPPTENDRSVAESISSDTGEDVERLVDLFRHQDGVRSFFEQVRTRYPQQYSAASQALYDGSPAWIALTGEVPADLVPLAEQLPIPVELRGGAALSDAEREKALGPAWELFNATVEPQGASGGLFAPTAVFTVDYAPGGDVRADDTTAAAMVDAASAAIGRDVAFSVEFTADERDPLSTDPAVWFLPADSLPTPESTSVSVLVDQRACVNNTDPQSGLAAPEVEVTDTEVRIAIGAYIRKGPQGCPASPLTPLVVDLGQPLGGRTLVDVNGAVDDESVTPPEQIYGGPSIVVPASALPN